MRAPFEVYIAKHQGGRRLAATLLVDLGVGDSFGDAVFHTFTDAKCSMRKLDEIRSLASDTVHAIVFSQVNGPCGQGLIEEVRKVVIDGLVVVVSDDCSQWHDIQGISGFVHGNAATAMSVFSLMAALGVSPRLTCLDAEDVKDCLGTAGSAAALAEAVWC